MKIKIQKGIPITPIVFKPKTLPFDKLEVGDSFFVKLKSGTLYNKAWSYKKLNEGFKFKVREERDGARIWRTA